MPHVTNLTARPPSMAPGAFGRITEGRIPLFEAMLAELDEILAVRTDLCLAIHDAKEKLGRLSVYASPVP